MEFLLILIVVGLIINIWEFISEKLGNNNTNSNQTNRNRSNQNQPRSRNTPHNKSHNKDLYRPTTRKSNTTIKFNTVSSTNSQSKDKAPTESELKGLHDAFTGAPLDIKLGLYQCTKCKVFYHTESYGVLKEANNSQCVSCQSTLIVLITKTNKAEQGSDYKPNVITLSNYKDHIGRVVTFEGYVHKVNESRRGNDFAVMFENKSWSNGFKLVFFSDAVRQVGVEYIKLLKGRTITVRGLLIKHETFGYQIIISEPGMIVDVK